MRHLCFVLMLLSLWFVALATRSVAAQATAVTLHQIDDSHFPEMNVIVSVTEGSRPVTDLKAEDFTLGENGEPVPVQELTTLARSEEGVSLLLVLDVSQSMAANNGLANAKTAALNLIDRLRPNDRVALLAFSGTVDLNLLDAEREIEFTEDHAAVRTRIDALQASGGTPLYDATLKAVRMTLAEARGSRAIILLTDGRDERIEESVSVPASVFTDSDAINEARAAETPIFAIGLGSEVNRNFLLRLADQSGGSFQEAPSAEQLEQFFNNALDQLLQRYLIRYESQVEPDTGTHFLLVQVETGADRAGVSDTFVSRPPDTPGIRLNVQDGEEVEGTLRLLPQIFAREEITQVELLVDNETVTIDTNSPYVLTWRTTDPRWSEVPTHTLTVRATDNEGDMGERTLTVTLLPPPAPSTQSSDDSGTTGTIAPSASPVEDDPEQTETNNNQPSETITADSAENNEIIVSPTAPADGPNWLLLLLLLTVAGLLLLTPLLLRARQNPTPQTTAVVLPQVVPPVRTAAPKPQDTDEITLFDRTTSSPPHILETDTDQTVLLRPEIPPILAYLVEVEGVRQGHTYQLDDQRINVGRGSEAKIRLADPTVSRNQAIILQEEGSFLLHALPTSNPTWLNGTEVEGRVPLQNGDMIEMGTTRLQFMVVETVT